MFFFGVYFIFFIGSPCNHSSLTGVLPSVMDTHSTEEIRCFEGRSSKSVSQLDRIKVPGLLPSMSMSDLVSHITEQMTPDNPVFSGNKQHRRNILEDITQYLFSDSQLTSASEEQSLMSRVNSLCCLLQKDPSTIQNLQASRDDDDDYENGDKKIGEAAGAAAHDENRSAEEFPATGGEPNDASGCKQATAMSRKDSFVDLLVNLPRIASLPQFLFNLPEDSDNQAR